MQIQTRTSTTTARMKMTEAAEEGGEERGEALEEESRRESVHFNGKVQLLCKPLLLQTSKRQQAKLQNDSDRSIEKTVPTPALSSRQKLVHQHELQFYFNLVGRL